MITIMLKPSRMALMAGVLVHLLAVIALFLSRLPMPVQALLLSFIALSLYWQYREFRLAGRRIIGLQLARECCRPIIRGGRGRAGEEPVLSGRGWNSAFALVLVFEPRGGGFWGFATRRLRRRRLLVMPDSCTAQEWKQLRRFLRWRCCYEHETGL